MDTSINRRLFVVAGLALVLFSPRQTQAAQAAQAAPISLDERIILVPAAGSEREDRDISIWQKRVEAANAANQAAAGNYERLGWAYISKARRTLDAGYYKLAEKTADVMDARFGPTDEALLLRGHVYHNLHRFQDAEQVARRLVAHRGTGLRLRAPERRPDGTGQADGVRRRLREDDGPEARGGCLQPRGEPALADRRPARCDRGDGGGGPRGQPAGRHQHRVDALPALVLLPPGGQDRPTRCGRRDCRGEARCRLPAGSPRRRGAPSSPWASPTQAVRPFGTRRDASIPSPSTNGGWPTPFARAATRTGAAQVEAELVARGEAADPRTFSLFLATRGEEPARRIRLARAELANRGDVFTQDALAWALASSGDYAGAAGRDAGGPLRADPGRAALPARRRDRPATAASRTRRRAISPRPRNMTSDPDPERAGAPRPDARKPGPARRPHRADRHFRCRQLQPERHSMNHNRTRTSQAF